MFNQNCDGFFFIHSIVSLNMFLFKSVWDVVKKAYLWLGGLNEQTLLDVFLSIGNFLDLLILWCNYLLEVF